MAFEAKYFGKTSGAISTALSVEYCYTSSTDTMSQITQAGYFNVKQGTGLRVRDKIRIISTVDNKDGMYAVTNIYPDITVEIAEVSDGTLTEAKFIPHFLTPNSIANTPTTGNGFGIPLVLIRNLNASASFNTDIHPEFKIKIYGVNIELKELGTAGYYVQLEDNDANPMTNQIPLDGLQYSVIGATTIGDTVSIITPPNKFRIVYHSTGGEPYRPDILVIVYAYKIA